MSAEEIRDELRTSLVGGHDTTAGQLSWGFMMLARAPEIAAHPRRDSRRREVYLNATIHEIMRLHPVAPTAEPRLTEGVEIGGWEYPPGISLLACAHLVHRDPEIYPDRGASVILTRRAAPPRRRPFGTDQRGPCPSLPPDQVGVCRVCPDGPGLGATGSGAGYRQAQPRTCHE
jgi:cytochrome P450